MFWRIVNSRIIGRLWCKIESMSGHSKWSTIKHKKAVEDQKKGAVFTKIAKKIQIAVRKGNSGDLEANPFLRGILEEARGVSMPMENVKRAVDKALGAAGGGQMEEVVYEIYGPGGVGLLVTTATDNRNRTGGEIKLIVDRADGSLGAPGSVSYLKNINPTPLILLSGDDLDRCIRLIEHLSDHDDVVDVWTNLGS